MSSIIDFYKNTNILNKETIYELNDRFNKIKDLNWVESKSNGNGSGGITFEILLGKQKDNFELPDYEGIEIKTKTQKGFKITLFNATPDNNFFEIKRLIKQYGYLNKNSDKIFRFYASTKISNKLPNNISVNLKLDEKNKLVKLQIFDINNNLLEDKVSWSFELLEEKLYRKLKYLAIVDVIKKKYKNKIYYKYTNITFYELKNFNQFLYLIKLGIIKIKFNVAELIKENGCQKIYDHGTSFDIKIENINKLFNKM